MLEPVRYACANWLIAPTALALNEAPPATISDQGFQLMLTGVAVFTFQGEPDASGWWRKNSIHIIPPGLDEAHAYAADRVGIAPPPGQTGNQFTRQFQVEQIAPFVGLASVEGSPDDLVHEVGWACDAWRPHPFNTLTDAFTRTPLPQLFNGIDADLAVFTGSKQIHRVNYHVTLIGKLRFAAVIIS